MPKISKRFFAVMAVVVILMSSKLSLQMAEFSQAETEWVLA